MSASLESGGAIPETLGPYRVDRRIGQGGMGEVFRGYDARLERPVALKHVKADIKDPGTARERFQREARALARVRHPAVVQIYDWVESEDGDWIVMEFLEGRSLDSHIEDGPLGVRRALEIACDIAAGLAAVHAHGIVHRDLKPTNVMLVPPGADDTASVRISADRVSADRVSADRVSADRVSADRILADRISADRISADRVKILDFGLAKRVASTDGVPLTESISKEGMIVGTVRFISPEQAAGRRVDPRSDLFSLGVMLYEMLTGVSPFAGDSAVETLTRICTVAETPVHRRDPAIPEAVSELVRRLLEKEAERRPQSAAEVAEALAGLAAGLIAGRRDHELWAALPEGTGDQTWSTDGAFESATTLVSEVGVEGLSPLAVPRDTKKVRRVWEVSGRLSGWRLRVASLAALVVLSLAGLGTRQLWLLREVPDPTYVVVPPPQILADGAELEIEAGAVHDGLLRALLGLRGIAAVEPGSRDVDVDRPKVLARALGADEVLVSQLDCDPGVCRIVLKRVQGSDGRILWNGRLTGTIDNLLGLSLAVADQVRGAYPEVERREGVTDLRVRPEDYENFLRLEERYWSRQGAGVVDDVLHELRSLRQSSPGFLEAYDFEVGILATRFDELRRPEDLEHALGLIEQARRLAPGDPRISKAATKIYQVSGKTDEAHRELAVLERWEPGDAALLELEARTLRREGRFEEARALMEDVVARRPAWNYFATFAVLDREMGDPDARRRHLEEMLARAPDNYYCQSILAEFELSSGNVERATRLYEQVVSRSPEATELNNLGVCYLLQERYADAARTYRRVFELAPDSPHALLNLADAELLAGDPAAKERYEQVLARIARDPDPDALLLVKAQALAQLGRPEDAVAAVQDALRRSPDDPLVAYVAAVVYSIVGEETSALLHARRALASGLDSIWFDFVWFDRIRERLSVDAEPAG